MKVVQAVGPFDPNEDDPISFEIPQSGVKYIKFGIQAPQAPWLLAVPCVNPPDFTAYMVRFTIDDYTFVVNGNGILEFEDFYRPSVFTIKPLQPMDAYTIIDIAFINEEESA